MFQLAPPWATSKCWCHQRNNIYHEPKEPLERAKHTYQGRRRAACCSLGRCHGLGLTLSASSSVRRAGRVTWKECFHLGFLIADVGSGPVLQTFPSEEITMVCGVLPNFQARPKDQLKILKLVGACLNQAGPISSRCRTAALHRG